MNIKCGNCGKDIVVPDGLVAGQHVRCPHCNEKTAFDKPSRIELPEGFEVKRQSRAKIDALKRAQAEQKELSEERRPTLSIRRPEQATTREREYRNAAAAAVGERVRTAERRKRIARLKQSFGNFISITVLLTILFVGYVVWKAVRKQALPARLPDAVTEMITNVVEKVNAEIGK